MLFNSGVSRFLKVRHEMLRFFRGTQARNLQNGSCACQNAALKRPSQIIIAQPRYQPIGKID